MPSSLCIDEERDAMFADCDWRNSVVVTCEEVEAVCDECVIAPESEGGLLTSLSRFAVGLDCICRHGVLLFAPDVTAELWVPDETVDVSEGRRATKWVQVQF
jgi:hypothetical protein